MARYKIWDKTETIITPIGEVLTPEQWVKRYPMAGLAHIKFVIADDVINGAYAGELSNMRKIYASQGCTFDDSMTDAEVLAAIEAFEDAQAQAVESDEPSPEERIAAALEYQVIASMDDAGTEEV